MFRRTPAALGLALATAALLAAGPAAAAADDVPQSFNVSAAGGRSHVDADCTGLTTCQKDDTAFKVIGGWNLNPGLSAELTYYSLGTAKFGIAGVAQADVKGSFWGIGLAGHHDFTPMFGALIRGGWAQGSAKTTDSAPGFPSVTEERNGRSHWYYGAGARIIVAPKWIVNIDYDFTRVSSYIGGFKNTDDVSSLMVGATYTF